MTTHEEVNPEPTDGIDLAAIRQLLADHERRLYPAGPGGLPEPTRQLKVGYDMDGLYWEVGGSHSKWTIVARFAEPKEPIRCVYIHTPHSLRNSHPDYPGDTVAMPYADARELAASILAAISHGDDELARKRGSQWPRKTDETQTPEVSQ